MGLLDPGWCGAPFMGGDDNCETGNGQGVRKVFLCSAIWRVDPYNLMPPKRKYRPTSSSSDSFSPEEKRSREANRFKRKSETEDEVLTALSMADSLGKKLKTKWI